MSKTKGDASCHCPNDNFRAGHDRVFGKRGACSEIVCSPTGQLHDEFMMSVNEIIGVINRSANKDATGAMLYLGDRQFCALRYLEKADPKSSITDKKCWGYPIVRVLAESFCKLLTD